MNQELLYKMVGGCPFQGSNYLFLYQSIIIETMSNCAKKLCYNLQTALKRAH